jgi:hypothetical protein
MPQFTGSLVVSAQRSVQNVVPPPHTDEHAPFEHAVPVAQRTPHRPQFMLSLVTTVSQPLAGFMSQSAKPALHAPTRHVPPVHAPVALGGRHTTPQPPQCVAVVASEVSQPLVGFMSQSPKPAAHPRLHIPSAHEAVDPAPEGH